MTSKYYKMCSVFFLFLIVLHIAELKQSINSQSVFSVTSVRRSGQHLGLAHACVCVCVCVCEVSCKA